MTYAFGDSDVAAIRLKIVAEVFAESSKHFFIQVGVNPQLALDLGCGPGYSTHLLADILRCQRTVGLDSSERFLSLAKKTETGRVSFRLHDVTSVPFPVGLADLIHCRFLLLHLRDPLGMVLRWASQLRPNGLILIEETESIGTDTPVFLTYLQVVEAMLASQGSILYVGRILDELEHRDGLRLRSSRTTLVRVPNRLAAKMFLLNLKSWKDHPFIEGNYSPVMIGRLAEEMEALGQKSEDESPVEWGIKQLILEPVWQQ